MKKLMLFMLISIGLVGCMHSKDGKIVRDSEGNYYELVGLRSLLTILALSAILILVYSIKKGNKLIQENF